MSSTEATLPRRSQNLMCRAHRWCTTSATACPPSAFLVTANRWSCLPAGRIVSSVPFDDIISCMPSMPHSARHLSHSSISASMSWMERFRASHVQKVKLCRCGGFSRCLGGRGWAAVAVASWWDRWWCMVRVFAALSCDRRCRWWWCFSLSAGFWVSCAVCCRSIVVSSAESVVSLTMDAVVAGTSWS